MSLKSVMIRNIKVGGGAPVGIQSMTNVDAHDEGLLLSQISELENAGCEIVRLAIPDIEAANTLKKLRNKTNMPIVADIHFDYKLALAAMDAGADKIRINPGNIGSIERVRAVVNEAKMAHIPIRVGVNSGSLEKDILEKYGKVTARGLCDSALRNVAIIEDMGFDDIVVSLKSSDVRMNYEAHRLIAQETEHPIHIGITEAGTVKRGKLKSAIGIGSLLLDGVGDTMRVSLTANPVEEVLFAREILETIGLREANYDLVSCPTCGRTSVNLEELAEKIDRRLADENVREGIKVAVMGCVVNGPGEAKGADYGVAGGMHKGVIFEKGEIVKTVKEEDIIDELFNLIYEREGITIR
jgi:4-hydroxy-3-methylbut-2-en-1-yl diphosphate synthase